MSKKLEIKDILLEKDFDKLKSQIVTLSVIMEKEYESTSDIYDDKDSILSNLDAYKIVKDHIFAGKTASKYWILPGLDIDNNKDLFKAKLEGLEVYNKNILSTLEEGIKNQTIEAPMPYTCIQIEEGLYLMRIITPGGNKRIDNGISKIKERQYKNVVCYIDLNNKYIEVRSEATLADKIKKYFEYNLKFQGITNINILGNFNNSIENFKNSFEDAKFTNLKSIPGFDPDLTDEELNSLVRVLGALDGYFVNKDEEILVEEILAIDIEENESGFIPLLLAGLSNIGISTNHADARDITKQPMYKVIESYLNHQSGMLVVNKNANESYSIQVGMKTDSIVFQKHSTNESFITEVRNKILKI